MPDVKYNTGPFATRAIDSEQQAGIDDVMTSMLVVATLAGFTNRVRLTVPVTPLIFPGVFDTDITTLMQCSVVDWYDNCPDEFEPASKHLLVAGHHESAGKREGLSVSRLQDIFDGGPVIHSQVEAENTPDQVRWVADQVEELDLVAVALRAHPFHVMRAFLTQLAEFRRRRLKVILLPWLSLRDPFGQFPLTNPWSETKSDAELWPGEAKRILDYSQKGDVSTLADLKDYSDWLFNESAAASGLRPFGA